VNSRTLRFDGTHRLIGVVHLLPLPGSPGWQGDMRSVIRAAVADAKAYEDGGADALIIENFGDLPFSKHRVPPETATAMAVAGAAVREAVRLPIGFNVLRNDAHTAVALCAACGGGFVRVNVHSGAMITDQGLIEGQAFETMRLIESLAPGTAVFADVLVKHAAPLGALSIEIAARDTVERGLASAVVVSGTGTGEQTDPEDVRRVRKACPDTPILLGSGVSTTNVDAYLGIANGFIVGTSVKRAGKLANPVDARRVHKLRSMLGN
jgi:membrane complex biogenesis protein, BtpA family